LGPARGPLHSPTRKLAESGGDRTQLVLAAMPRKSADTGSERVETRNAGLESQDRPPADQDQLAVRAPQGPKAVPPPEAWWRRPNASGTDHTGSDAASREELRLKRHTASGKLPGLHAAQSVAQPPNPAPAPPSIVESDPFQAVGNPGQCDCEDPGESDRRPVRSRAWKVPGLRWRAFGAELCRPALPPRPAAIL
jgi:hypothetical protein